MVSRKAFIVVCLQAVHVVTQVNTFELLRERLRNITSVVTIQCSDCIQCSDYPV